MGSLWDTLDAMNAGYVKGGVGVRSTEWDMACRPSNLAELHMRAVRHMSGGRVEVLKMREKLRREREEEIAELKVQAEEERQIVLARKRAADEEAAAVEREELAKAVVVAETADEPLIAACVDSLDRPVESSCGVGLSALAVMRSALSRESGEIVESATVLVGSVASGDMGVEFVPDPKQSFSVQEVCCAVSDPAYQWPVGRESVVDEVGFEPDDSDELSIVARAYHRSAESERMVGEFVRAFGMQEGVSRELLASVVQGGSEEAALDTAAFFSALDALALARSRRLRVSLHDEDSGGKCATLGIIRPTRGEVVLATVQAVGHSLEGVASRVAAVMQLAPVASHHLLSVASYLVLNSFVYGYEGPWSGAVARLVAVNRAVRFVPKPLVDPDGYCLSRVEYPASHGIVVAQRACRSLVGGLAFATVSAQVIAAGDDTWVFPDGSYKSRFLTDYGISRERAVQASRVDSSRKSLVYVRMAADRRPFHEFVLDILMALCHRVDRITVAYELFGPEDWHEFWQCAFDSVVG